MQLAQSHTHRPETGECWLDKALEFFKGTVVIIQITIWSRNLSLSEKTRQTLCFKSKQNI